MKKTLLSIVAAAVTVIAISAPVGATVASGNRGSIVKLSNTCAGMGDVASNNHGSIVKIEGNGRCDINEIMKSSAVQNNKGSIIKISNVCGNTDGIANNNHGSIIKIDSTGPCETDEPTTVVVTPHTPETPEVAVVKPVAAAAPSKETPAELPSTGAGSMAGMLAVAAGALTYAGTYARSLRLARR